MLTHLVVLLDDTSISYCHYQTDKTLRRLIGQDDLKAGILYAMKENLNIQFVYPSYELPEAYRELIDTIDHTKIGPVSCGEELDVAVVNNLNFETDHKKCYLWRCTIDELAHTESAIIELLPKVYRLNVVLTDIPNWKERELDVYKEVLEHMADKIVAYYQKGMPVQLNLITDRFMLEKMNNCNAGDANVTLAPDGRFYICPAYYYQNSNSVGSIKEGLQIPNKQLYKLDHAPICRKCDAFQCRRCVWMNELMTLDCNTPSHEQCVAAHLERNVSRKLLLMLNEKGIALQNSYGIEEINYLDPFNILNKWK